MGRDSLPTCDGAVLRGSGLGPGVRLGATALYRVGLRGLSRRAAVPTLCFAGSLRSVFRLVTQERHCPGPSLLEQHAGQHELR